MNEAAALEQKVKQIEERDVRIFGLEAAISQLNKQIEELEAALAGKNEALKAAAAFVPESYLQKSIIPAALTLQPHASLVAKIKADAVQAFAKWYGIAGDADEYVERIERGEVK